MTTQRPSRLGRGLDGLLTRTEPTGDAGPTLNELDIGSIRPNPKQPRHNFDEDELEELTESVRSFGVLQPIVVRPLTPGSYELVMGERRLRASERAGKRTIPAIVRHSEDDAILRDALLENLHRSDLNPIEEAMAYQQLLEEFNCTQEELSARIQRSRPQISNTLRLLRLPTSVQVKVAAGVLSAGHAKVLLGLESPGDQEQVADRIIAEGLSVRSTEELVLMWAGEHDRAEQAAHTPHALEQEREISTRLSDHFDTRVKVNIGRSKGRITIEFAERDDLERIMAIINGKTV